jgi:hypothetical protein
VPGLLALGMISSVVNIVMLATAGSQASSGAEWAAPFEGLPGWFFTAAGLLNVVQLVLLMAIWAWQRWAVYVLALLPIACAAIVHYSGFAAINSPGNEMAAIAGALIGGYIPIAVLVGAMMIGRPSYWSQMD